MQQEIANRILKFKLELYENKIIASPKNSWNKNTISIAIMEFYRWYGNILTLLYEKAYYVHEGNLKEFMHIP